MIEREALYSELKPDIEAISLLLFKVSKRIIEQQGAFLPHGAILLEGRKPALVGAKGEKELTNSVETLPLLHGALRALVKSKTACAIGVAEDVIVKRPGKESTRAIKVLFEHQSGLTVALYEPFRKSLFKFRYGEIFAMSAPGEVNPWQGALNA